MSGTPRDRIITLGTGPSAPLGAIRNVSAGYVLNTTGSYIVAS